MDTTHLIGITDLRTNAKAVISHLDEHPVTILSRSKPVGVLIHPARWEQLMDQLDDLEAQIALTEREHDTVPIADARKAVLGD